jgi:hypothetical protein
LAWRLETRPPKNPNKRQHVGSSFRIRRTSWDEHWENKPTPRPHHARNPFSRESCRIAAVGTPWRIAGKPVASQAFLLHLTFYLRHSARICSPRRTFPPRRPLSCGFLLIISIANSKTSPKSSNYRSIESTILSSQGKVP